MEPFVSIILLNYNSYIHTIECVSSIKKSNYRNYEIIIVDNNSTDDSLLYLEKLKDQNIFLIKNSINSGFAAGNNEGIKLANEHKSDFVFLLNNDTIVEKNTLLTLINTYKYYAHKYEIGIITCLILNYYERDIIWYAGGNIAELKGDAVGTRLGKRANDMPKDNERLVTFASGCCMLIPMKVLNECGFLPEKYFLYYEDVDFCVNVHSHHKKIMYTNKTCIYHKESVSTKRNSPDYVYYYCRNRLQFIKDNVKLKYKMVAYFYTYLWIFKKIIFDHYTLKDSFAGIVDFFNEKTGRRANKWE